MSIPLSPPSWLRRCLAAGQIVAAATLILMHLSRVSPGPAISEESTEMQVALLNRTAATGGLSALGTTFFGLPGLTIAPGALPEELATNASRAARQIEELIR